jgi:hypothetical protein
VDVVREDRHLLRVGVGRMTTPPTAQASSHWRARQRRTNDVPTIQGHEEEPNRLERPKRCPKRRCRSPRRIRKVRKLPSVPSVPTRRPAASIPTVTRRGAPAFPLRPTCHLSRESNEAERNTHTSRRPTRLRAREFPP